MSAQEEPSAPDLTRNQSLVFAALDRAEGPMSAYAILDAVRDEGIRAPQQIYRALDKLIELGMIHRLESLNAFVACCHPHPHAHQHAVAAFSICERCGKVGEMTDEGLIDRLKRLAAADGFQIRATTLEVRGLCADCGRT
ncbi:MAG: Fur family transcriptional regulator [Marivibrio sp.]|uniref:Fur family transcriptional regulator n=1 Tax=Marivibrio sp. TaxID=2039719 RepID=UPI0032ED7EEE